jgi:hypothetical protein
VRAERCCTGSGNYEE